MKQNKNCGLKISFLFLALFLFAVAYCIPYTHDDWDWGLPVGMSQFLNATINSRYAGNLIVILLTRSELLKTLVLGLFFLCMPLFTIYICTGKKPDFSCQSVVLALLSYALHLLIPGDMWGQTNGWVSGFANYSFSTFLLCFFIKFSYELFDNDNKNYPVSKLKVFLSFFIALSLQLFLENLTVYLVAVSLCIFVANWIYRKKTSACAAALLLGTLLGTFIMFSSDIYPALVETGQAVEGVRKIIIDMDASIFSIIYHVTYNFIAIVLSELYKGYWLSSLILFIVLFWLAFENKSSQSKALFVCIQIANALLIVYYLGQAVNIDSLLCRGNTRYMAILKLLTALGTFFMVCLEIILFEKDKKRRLFSLALWVSAPLVVLPMSIVNAVGPRAFYTSTFFILLLVTVMADKLIYQLGTPAVKAVAALCAAVFLASCVRLAFVYSDIGQVKIQRDRIIASAKASQASEMLLPEYQHNRKFLWEPTPYEYHRLCYFKEFYEIDMSVNVMFEKYDPTS